MYVFIFKINKFLSIRLLILVPEYHVVLPKLLNSRTKRSTDEDSKPSKWTPKAKEKIVHLKVFGKAMQLNLKPNDNFNERLNQMKVLLAESGKNGKLKYVEDKLSKVGARLVPFGFCE